MSESINDSVPELDESSIVLIHLWIQSHNALEFCRVHAHDLELLPVTERARWQALGTMLSELLQTAEQVLIQHGTDEILARTVRHAGPP